MSLCFLSFVPVHSATCHMSIAHKEEKLEQAALYRQRSGSLEEGVLGGFGRRQFISGGFAR